MQVKIEAVCHQQPTRHHQSITYEHKRLILHKAGVHRVPSFPHNMDPDKDLTRMPAKELQQS
jgi:hypothetical protein